MKGLDAARTDDCAVKDGKEGLTIPTVPQPGREFERVKETVTKIAALCDCRTMYGKRPQNVLGERADRIARMLAADIVHPDDRVAMNTGPRRLQPFGGLVRLTATRPFGKRHAMSLEFDHGVFQIYGGFERGWKRTGAAKGSQFGGRDPEPVHQDRLQRPALVDGERYRLFAQDRRERGVDLQRLPAPCQNGRPLHVAGAIDRQQPFQRRGRTGGASVKLR